MISGRRSSWVNKRSYVGSIEDKKTKKGKNGIVVPDDTHRHLVYSELISSVITVEYSNFKIVLGRFFLILTDFGIFRLSFFFIFFRFFTEKSFLFLLIFEFDPRKVNFRQCDQSFIISSYDS